MTTSDRAREMVAELLPCNCHSYIDHYGEHRYDCSVTLRPAVAEAFQRLMDERQKEGDLLRAGFDNALKQRDKAWAESDALRAELARIRAHIESSHNEVTCSQDARHANDGDDRVPMLTCMTWEAHTLRAEVATLRKEREYRCADLTAARERIEKLEAVKEAATDASCRMDSCPMCLNTNELDTLDAALAATEEESAK